MGPEVETFEQEFAEFLGVKHAIAVANGTAALHLSLLALEVGPADEVIQPAINFVAAANMTLAVGARPIFADIVSLDEPTIDPTDIETRITSRTKVILVMHYGGYLSRMAEIQAICQRYSLALVEDACHALGASYLDPEKRIPHAKKAGNLSDVGCFSFFSNKNLAVGEGGMVVTNRDDLAKRVRLFRSHGMTTLTWDRYKGHSSAYDVVLNGYNYRLDELRAALGRSQLRKLRQNNHLRAEIVARYRGNLEWMAGWVIPFARFSGESAYHLMVAIAPDESTRDKVVEALKAERIQTSLHYPYLPGFTAFGNKKADQMFSVSLSKRAITLPLFPKMTISQVDEICGLVREYGTWNPEM
jgi:dTDP-4-amino-4,6-dideoxygalactose transaminase